MQALPSTEQEGHGPARRITALVVHEHGEHMARYEEFLRLQGAEVARARTCQEAAEAVHQDAPPLLVLTDTRLPDGGFQDILRLAAKAEAPVNVLVASKVGNITTYMEAMEGGAFDFLTPGTEASAFPSIILSATEDAMEKRSRPQLRRRRAPVIA